MARDDEVIEPVGGAVAAESLDPEPETEGRTAETKRLNLKKLNKPVIIDGGTITSSFGVDGDTLFYKSGGTRKFGIKMEGEWWGITLHKL